MSGAADATFNRPTVADDGDDLGRDDGSDGARDVIGDARARDTRRDAPIDAAPDGPCPPCTDQRTDQNWDGGFNQRLSIATGSLVDDFIAFSEPRPGHGRDLLFKREDASIAVLASTGRLCPSQAIEP